MSTEEDWDESVKAGCFRLSYRRARSKQGWKLGPSGFSSNAIPSIDWGYILLGLRIRILTLYFTAREVEQIRSC